LRAFSFASSPREINPTKAAPCSANLLFFSLKK